MQSRRFIVVTIIVWSTIALASAGDEYMYVLRGGRELSFLFVLGASAPGWAVWALATPAIVRLSQRFPTWPPRARAVAVHIAAWLVVSVAFAITTMLASHVFPVAATPNPAAWPTRVWQNLISWSPSLLMAYAAIIGVGHALSYAAQVQREQSE